MADIFIQKYRHVFKLLYVIFDLLPPTSLTSNPISRLLQFCTSISFRFFCDTTSLFTYTALRYQPKAQTFFLDNCYLPTTMERLIGCRFSVTAFEQSCNNITIGLDKLMTVFVFGYVGLLVKHWLFDLECGYYTCNERKLAAGCKQL